MYNMDCHCISYHISLNIKYNLITRIISGTSSEVERLRTLAPNLALFKVNLGKWRVDKEEIYPPEEDEFLFYIHGIK